MNIDLGLHQIGLISLEAKYNSSEQLNLFAMLGLILGFTTPPITWHCF